MQEVSGDVAELGEVSSGEGEPVLRLSAPELGSTLRGVVWACDTALPTPLESGLRCSSLKAGLMVISGLELPVTWRAAGDLGPLFTVMVSPEWDSFNSRSFSCHSRA